MHLFKRFIATPLLDPEDRAGGGSMSDGADDPGATGADGADPSMGAADEGADDDGYDADAADDPEAAGHTDDDDDDGDDAEFLDTSRSLEERFNALVKKHTKTKRQNFRNRPLVRLAKELQITPGALADMVSKARNYDALQSGSPESRRLLRQLIGDEEPAAGRKPAKGKTRQPSPDDDEDDDFDPSTLPFDATQGTGPFFAAEAKRARKMERTLAQIAERLDQVEGGVTKRFETVERREVATKWKTALEAAAPRIENKGLRTIFEDSVKAAYHLNGGKDKTGQPLDPMRVINHYLKLIGVKPQQAALARSAAQQRIVQKNEQRPRHQGGGHGSPAPAEGARPKTLADVHRSIRSRLVARA